MSTQRFDESLKLGKLVAAKCLGCNRIHMPPRPLCNGCFSRNLELVHIGREGTLVTYSEIYVSNDEYQDCVPYLVGILELDPGVRIAGMIRGAQRAELRVGMRLRVEITQEKTDESVKAPYYFTKV